MQFQFWGAMAFDIKLWGLASEWFLARAGEITATSDLILGEVASTPVLEDHSESECSMLLGIRSPCILIRDSWRVWSGWPLGGGKLRWEDKPVL